MKKINILILLTSVNSFAMQKELTNLNTLEAVKENPTDQTTNISNETTEKLKKHIRKKNCKLVSILTCSCCCYPCYKKCCFSDSE